MIRIPTDRLTKRTEYCPLPNSGQYSKHINLKLHYIIITLF